MKNIKLFISLAMHGIPDDEVISKQKEIALQFVRWNHPIADIGYREGGMWCVTDDRFCYENAQISVQDKSTGETYQYEIIDNLRNHDTSPFDGNERIYRLGESISMMAKADVVLFEVDGNKHSPGANVEHEVAVQYGLEYYGVFDNDDHIYQERPYPGWGEVIFYKEAQHGRQRTENDGEETVDAEGEK